MTGITLIIALVNQFYPANLSDTYHAFVASLTPTEVVIAFDGESNVKEGAVVLLNGQVTGEVVSSNHLSNSTNVTVRIAGKVNSAKDQYVAIVSSPMSVARSGREPVIELLKIEQPMLSRKKSLSSELKGYSSYEKFWRADLS